MCTVTARSYQEKKVFSLFWRKTLLSISPPFLLVITVIQSHLAKSHRDKKAKQRETLSGVDRGVFISQKKKKRSQLKKIGMLCPGNFST